MRVVAIGKGAGLRDGLGAVRLQIRWQPLVVVSHRSESRKQHLVGQIVQGIRHQHVVIEQTGNDDQPVQVDAVARGQMLCQACAPDAAVALARDELRRAPALLTSEPHADEFAHGRNVLLHAQKLIHLLRVLRMAETCVHGINENQVRRIQQTERILHETPRRSRRSQSIGRQFHLLRSKGPQMHPHAAGSRAAVETEGDRPCCSIRRALQRVGRVKHLCRRFAVGLQDRHLAASGHVLHLLAINGNGAFRPAHLRFLVVRLLFFGLLRLGLFGLFLGRWNGLGFLCL